MATLIGPFPGRVKPVRSGLYQRRSPKSGTLCWAWFDHGSGQWGTFSSSKANAVAAFRRGKYSSRRLQWFGRVK